MADSFFAGKDFARLYAGSMAFSAKISADPESVGLTSQIADEYAVLNAAFATLHLQAACPNTRTHPVVIGRNAAAAVLRKRAAQLAKFISGTPAVTDQQRAELDLNVRKAPSPRPSPGKPYDFRVSLVGNGSLELRWKCKNIKGWGGTVYEVVRRETAGEPFQRVAVALQKRVVDAALPAGTTSVTYMVRGVRSNSAGDWAQHNVTFGVRVAADANADAAATASKLAA